MKGKRWKNGGKGEIFTVPLGEKISFWEKGCGVKIFYFGKYTPGPDLIIIHYTLVTAFV